MNSILSVEFYSSSNFTEYSDKHVSLNIISVSVCKISLTFRIEKLGFLVLCIFISCKLFVWLKRNFTEFTI